MRAAAGVDLLLVHEVGGEAQLREELLGCRRGQVLLFPVTLSFPAIFANVQASASGATCVRCSSAPAATKQFIALTSSTSMVSATNLNIAPKAFQLV